MINLLTFFAGIAVGVVLTIWLFRYLSHFDMVDYTDVPITKDDKIYENS